MNSNRKRVACSGPRYTTGDARFETNQINPSCRLSQITITKHIVSWQVEICSYQNRQTLATGCRHPYFLPNFTKQMEGYMFSRYVKYVSMLICSLATPKLLVRFRKMGNQNNASCRSGSHRQCDVSH